MLLQHGWGKYLAKSAWGKWLATVRVRICLILKCAFASCSMSGLRNLFIVSCYDLWQNFLSKCLYFSIYTIFSVGTVRFIRRKTPSSFQCHIYWRLCIYAPWKEYVPFLTLLSLFKWTEHLGNKMHHTVENSTCPCAVQKQKKKNDLGE
jgi:hypothetical protein